MSDDEVDELLKAVDTSSGEINYTGRSLLRSKLRRTNLTGNPRSRPYYSRQLILLSRLVLLPFPRPIVHILLALFLSMQYSRPGFGRGWTYL